MQIQYCDDCGTRVDETELTAIAGKIYCKTCAKNHAPQPKAVGTGVYSNPRPSTRVTRLTKTPTPGRGGAKLGGSFNPEIPSAAESDYQEEYVEPAPPPSSGLGAWAKRNTALAISLVAGLVGVLLIVLWSVFSGPPKNNTAVAPPPNQLPSPASVKTTTDKKNTVATVTTKPTPAVVAPPVAVDDDPRTDKAMRDLAQIKELIAGNKANPFDIRKRLENLVEPFWIKKTPMGIEGEKLLAQFKNEKRPPDKADGAQPGLQARLGFDKAEELFNTDFKVADVKTEARLKTRLCAVGFVGRAFFVFELSEQLFAFNAHRSFLDPEGLDQIFEALADVEGIGFVAGDEFLDLRQIAHGFVGARVVIDGDGRGDYCRSWLRGDCGDGVFLVSGGFYRRR